MAKLHIALLPLVAHGHMTPMLEMAKLFYSRGLRTTVITTPAFADPISRAQQSGQDIGLSIIEFPPKGSSLPNNFVCIDRASSELLPEFVEALFLLKEQVDGVLHKLRPNCLVSDMFFPWTVDSAAELGIPRLVFHGTSYFARCAGEMMELHKAYENVSSDSEPFVLPDFPQRMMFVRTQVIEFVLGEERNALTKLIEQVNESERRSYGVVFNSFYELESAYVDHYKNVLGRKAWHIGPLMLCNNGHVEGEGSQRGKESAIDEHGCLVWLNSKRPNSIVYVCFGSISTFTPAQLHETAVGLEASGQDFIWVVRKGEDCEENEEWLPEGFEERMRGKGLIIREWAPQVMILDHPATGAFVTHCGWNSTLEGICAGLPMVTWPVCAEQFYNEKLVTEVLRIGISAGNKRWQFGASKGVSSEAFTKAVKSIMLGDEVSGMRSRAKHYKEMARKAVEEGGTSYTNLIALVEELNKYRCQPAGQEIN